MGREMGKKGGGGEGETYDEGGLLFAVGVREEHHRLYDLDARVRVDIHALLVRAPARTNAATTYGRIMACAHRAVMHGCDVVRNTVDIRAIRKNTREDVSSSARHRARIQARAHRRRTINTPLKERKRTRPKRPKTKPSRPDV